MAIRYLFVDCLIFSSSFFLAILVFRQPEFVVDRYSLMVIGVSVFTAISLLVVSRFYMIVISYVTVRVVFPVALSIAASSLVALSLSWVFDVRIAVAEVVIYFLLSFTGILGVRFLYRDVVARKRSMNETRVLIYGAGEAGRQILSSLNLDKKYLPVAFVDDNEKLHGLSVAGLKVLSVQKLPDFVVKFDIDLVVLAIPSISRQNRRELLLKLQNIKAVIRVIPGLDELMSNSVDQTDARPLSIDDILGRVSVSPDHQLMSQAVEKKIIMVTGAGGSIGSEICRQVCMNKPLKLILFDISEYALYLIHNELSELCRRENIDLELIPIIGTIQDYTKLKAIFKKFAVTSLFHAAAYKHVPLMELNIVEGVKNNVFGTKAVVDAAVDAGVYSVTLISTDKAVRPTNIMGATKRMAEFVGSSVKHNKQTIVAIVRFGNVLNSSGSVVPLFEKQILKGGPLTVTHPEVTRFFMLISEAAQLVIQASAMAKGGEVYLLDMGDPVKIIDLAFSMVKLQGKVPVIGEVSNSNRNTDYIPIIFSGLRPGEKLYEELLVNNSSKKTAHPLIMSAQEPGADEVTLVNYLRLLKRACDENNLEDIRKILIDAGTGLEHSGDFANYKELQ